MEFVETSVFSRRRERFLPDDEDFRALQQLILEDLARPRPQRVGTVIRHSGGVSKIRFSAEGRGKRGGLRVIYYYAERHDLCLLLFLFPKNERTDLTPGQVKRLAAVIKEEYP